MNGKNCWLMSLSSLWFLGNERLQRCLVSDSDHVKLGDQGLRVLLIQEALLLLYDGRINDAEIAALRYGPTADDIVGNACEKLGIGDRLFPAS